MKYVTVHFENESLKYTFATSILDSKIEQPVIVDTASGLELAYVAGPIVDEEPANLPTDKEIKEVIRVATSQDVAQYKENIELAKQAMGIVARCINECDLEMDLVSANYNFDRSKILITYVAEHRVDFRELLKVLNNELRCRVELRQIAIRQRAKFIGGIGPCGRSLCCATFMNDFQSVSINLAKNQGLSLNASKLTGQCGKLKCCLRFEDDLYTELNQGLPKVNSWVEFEGEKFKVASLNLLSNYVRLDNPLKSKMITVDELKELATPTQRLTKKAINEIKESGGHRLNKDVTVSDALKDNVANKEANRSNKSVVTPLNYSLDEPSVSDNKIKETVNKRVFSKAKKSSGNSESTSNNTRTFVKNKENQSARTNTNRNNNETNSTNKRVFSKKSNQEHTPSSSNGGKRVFKKSAVKDTIKIIEEHEAE